MAAPERVIAQRNEAIEPARQSASAKEAYRMFVREAGDVAEREQLYLNELRHLEASVRQFLLEKETP